MEKSERLSIDTYHFEELHITTNKAYVVDDDETMPLVNIDFRAFIHATEQDRFAVSLTVKTEEPLSSANPLQISVRIMGFFRVEEPITNGRIHPDRVVNGLTILYGIVRGQVGTAAAWFGHQIVLPTVYFSDLVNAQIAAAKRDALSDATPQLEAGTKVAV